MMQQSAESEIESPRILTLEPWKARTSSRSWPTRFSRKIENWVLLNVSNLFAIPLYFYKDLPMFAVFTAFLFIIAVFGYFDWRKRYKLQPV